MITNAHFVLLFTSLSSLSGVYGQGLYELATLDDVYESSPLKYTAGVTIPASVSAVDTKGSFIEFNSELNIVTFIDNTVTTSIAPPLPDFSSLPIVSTGLSDYDSSFSSWQNGSLLELVEWSSILNGGVQRVGIEDQIWNPAAHQDSYCYCIEISPIVRDRITIETIPEPSSVMLSCLGLVFMLRRRR